MAKAYSEDSSKAVTFKCIRQGSFRQSLLPCNRISKDVSEEDRLFKTPWQKETLHTTSNLLLRNRTYNYLKLLYLQLQRFSLRSIFQQLSAADLSHVGRAYDGNAIWQTLSRIRRKLISCQWRRVQVRAYLYPISAAEKKTLKYIEPRRRNPYSIV